MAFPFFDFTLALISKLFRRIFFNVNDFPIFNLCGKPIVVGQMLPEPFLNRLSGVADIKFIGSG